MQTVWVEGKNPIYARYTLICEFCGEPMYSQQPNKKLHAACRRKMKALYAAERRNK